MKQCCRLPKKVQSSVRESIGITIAESCESVCVIIWVGQLHFDLNWRGAVPVQGLGFAAIKAAAQDLPLWAASKSVVSLDMKEAMERWEGDAGQCCCRIVKSASSTLTAKWKVLLT